MLYGGQFNMEVQKQEPDSRLPQRENSGLGMIQQANWLLPNPYLTPRLENMQPFKNN